MFDSHRPTRGVPMAFVCAHLQLTPVVMIPDRLTANANPATLKLPGHHPKWSGRRVSNPRPSVWETDALPTELHPLGSAIL
jgi:hypothetical protein